MVPLDTLSPTGRPQSAGAHQVASYLRRLPAVLIAGFVALSAIGAAVTDHFVLSQVTAEVVGKARDLGVMLLSTPVQIDASAV